MSLEPRFVHANDGDYSLCSQAGRFDTALGDYVRDAVTSPCIDAGSPHDGVGREPQANGQRINQGALGGTAYASLTGKVSPSIEIVEVKQQNRSYFRIRLNAWDSDGQIVAVACSVNGVSAGLAQETTMDLPPSERSGEVGTRPIWELSCSMGIPEPYLVTAFAIDNEGNVTSAEPVIAHHAIGGEGGGGGGR